MASWPSIAVPDYPLGEEVNFPQVRSEFESGAVQARPKWSRSRRVFALSWGAMTANDFGTLETFFLANQGLAITWTHPLTSVVYTVRFRDDALKGEVIRRDRRRVQVTLEEC